jgi:hypothetical protein
VRHADYYTTVNSGRWTGVGVWRRCTNHIISTMWSMSQRVGSWHPSTKKLAGASVGYMSLWILKAGFTKIWCVRNHCWRQRFNNKRGRTNHCLFSRRLKFIISQSSFLKCWKPIKQTHHVCFNIDDNFDQDDETRSKKNIRMSKLYVGRMGIKRKLNIVDSE